MRRSIVSTMIAVILAASLIPGIPSVTRAKGASPVVLSPTLVIARPLSQPGVARVRLTHPSSAFIVLYVDGAAQGYTGANLRARPSMSASIILLIPNGAAVRVMPQPIREADGSAWYRATYNGRQGYVLASLLRPQSPSARSATAPRVAFTRGDNVYLANVDGSNPRQLTTDGSVDIGITYPSYSWSPDGRFLLLVRSTRPLGGNTSDAILLVSSAGVVLRTLASGLADLYPPFYPTWAMDSDQIAYIASITRGPSSQDGVLNLTFAVRRMSVGGRSSPLWSFTSETPVAGGGGTSDLAEQLYWREVGMQEMVQPLCWSTRLHVAVYSPTGIGLTIVVRDLATGRTRRIGTPLLPTGDASILPDGRLVYEASSDNPSAYGSNVEIDDLWGQTAAGMVASGAFPVWAHDGRTIYFTRTAVGRPLPLNENGNDMSSHTATVSIWAMDADGAHLRQLGVEEGYGLGPPQVTSDGSALIFTHIDDALALWQHRLPGNAVTQRLIDLYGPHTEVQRLNLADGRLVTITPDGHQPTVR